MLTRRQVVAAHGSFAYDLTVDSDGSLPRSESRLNSERTRRQQWAFDLAIFPGLQVNRKSPFGSVRTGVEREHQEVFASGELGPPNGPEASTRTVIYGDSKMLVPYATEAQSSGYGRRRGWSSSCAVRQLRSRDCRGRVDLLDTDIPRRLGIIEA
jgi:hypothetical protein